MAENTVFGNIEVGGEGEERRAGGEVLSWRDKLLHRLQSKHHKREEAERRAEEIPEEERGFVQFFKGIFAAHDEEDLKREQPKASWIEQAFDERDAEQVEIDDFETEQQRKLMELPEQERTEFYMIVAQRFKDAGGRFLHFVEEHLHLADHTELQQEAAATETDRNTQEFVNEVAAGFQRNARSHLAVEMYDKTPPSKGRLETEPPKSRHGLGAVSDEQTQVLTQSRPVEFRRPVNSIATTGGESGNLPPRAPHEGGAFGMDGPYEPNSHSEFAARFVPRGASREEQHGVVHYIHRATPGQLLTAALLGGYIGSRRTRNKLEREHRQERAHLQSQMDQVEGQNQLLRSEVRSEADRRTALEARLPYSDAFTTPSVTQVQPAPERLGADERTQQPVQAVANRTAPSTAAPPLEALMKHATTDKPVIARAPDARPSSQIEQASTAHAQVTMRHPTPKTKIEEEPLAYEMLESEPAQDADKPAVRPPKARPEETRKTLQASPRVTHTAESAVPVMTPASLMREEEREYTEHFERVAQAAFGEEQELQVVQRIPQTSTAMAGRGAPASVGQILSQRYGGERFARPANTSVAASSNDNDDDISDTSVQAIGVVLAVAVILILLLLF